MGLDIRIPLGLIFLITGGIMAVFGAFTTEKINCSASMMLLKFFAVYAAPIDNTIPPTVAIRPIQR